MPSFIVVVALWVGTNSERCAPGNVNYPGKAQSKQGVGGTLGGYASVLEQTDFFGYPPFSVSPNGMVLVPGRSATDPQGGR